MKKGLNTKTGLIEKLISENEMEMVLLQSKANGKPRARIPKAIRLRVTSLCNYNEYLRKYK